MHLAAGRTQANARVVSGIDVFLNNEEIAERACHSLCKPLPIDQSLGGEDVVELALGGQ
jgi:hypothetical protein